MKEKTPFDFDRFQQEAMEGLYAGKKAGGTDGVFAPLMKHLLESMLDGELKSHLDEEKASGVSNRRNGKSKKTVRRITAVALSWRQAGTARAVSSRRLSPSGS